MDICGAVDHLFTENLGLVLTHSYRNHPGFLKKFVIEGADVKKNITENLCGLPNLLCPSNLTSSTVSYITPLFCGVLDRLKRNSTP